MVTNLIRKKEKKDNYARIKDFTDRHQTNQIFLDRKILIENKTNGKEINKYFQKDLLRKKSQIKVN